MKCPQSGVTKSAATRFIVKLLFKNSFELFNLVYQIITVMKTFFVAALVVVVVSCTTEEVRPVVTDEAFEGFWIRETVYFEGEDSYSYVDYLNGSNYLDLKSDKTAGRCYLNGQWKRTNNTLSLDWDFTNDYDEQLEVLWITPTHFMVSYQAKTGTFSSIRAFQEKFGDREYITVTELYTLTNN